MALKKFDIILYRNATTPITTIAYSGSTPSGWTPLTANAFVETSKIELDKSHTTEIADGTTYIGSDKGEVEFSIIGDIAAAYPAVRTAFINRKVDVLLIDSDAKDPAIAIFAARLYPKLEAGDSEPKISCSGTVERSSEAVNKPVTIIKVT